MRVLISGLGIAGPALAFWLRRAGADVTIVERAASLRTGGYIIDFWGSGYEVAQRMGIMPRLNERGYFVKEVRFVGADGKRAGGFSADLLRRALDNAFVSLPRSELSAAMYDAIADDVEVLWDDTVTELQPARGGVDVTFEQAQPRSFDLVFGAGGLHSPVRTLCFAPEDRVECYLGYMVAACNVSGYRRRDEDIYVSYGEPGRQVSRFAMHDDRTLFLFVWRDDEGVDAHADSLKQRREAMLRRFAGMGWETGDILAAITESDDLYFDRVSQIHMPRWSRDRIALVGDAAFCPSLLAGEVSALAMTAAYVLAGELRLADWDHAAAFARYEQKLRPFIEKKQKAAADFAAAFAPKTRLGIALRNLVTRAFVIPGVADLAIGSSLKDDFALPMYAL